MCVQYQYKSGEDLSHLVTIGPAQKRTVHRKEDKYSYAFNTGETGVMRDPDADAVELQYE